MRGYDSVTDLLAFLFLLSFYIKGAVTAWLLGGWWLVWLLPPLGILFGICDFIGVDFTPDAVRPS
jgi:hypothetical protein